MMKSESTIWRALWCPEKARVMIARTTKLVPPAKSRINDQFDIYSQAYDCECKGLPVSLSNLRENAMEKKNSWYAMVIRRVMAK